VFASPAFDIPMDAMSLTPGAGSYVVLTSATFRIDDPVGTITISIYVDGKQVKTSQRRHSGGLGDVSVSTQHFAAEVLAGQLVEVRWNSKGATTILQERSLLLMKVD